MTVTLSVTDAGPNRASTGSVCVGASVTVFVTRSNPLSSKEIVYVPDGNSGNTKSPFSVVTTVRTPCRLGDAAFTVTPGRASPCWSATCPEMVPFVVCAAEPAATPKSATAASSHVLANVIHILLRRDLLPKCASFIARENDDFCNRFDVRRNVEVTNYPTGWIIRHFWFPQRGVSASDPAGNTATNLTHRLRLQNPICTPTRAIRGLRFSA